MGRREPGSGAPFTLIAPTLTATLGQTTDIQVTLMTPSATSMAISPTLEPAQQSPNWNPERTLSRQRRRKYRLSGVNSYTPAAITTTPAATDPCGRYNAYTAAPARAQTAR